jgi:excisionase family DNA binding protein
MAPVPSSRLARPQITFPKTGRGVPLTHPFPRTTSGAQPEPPRSVTDAGAASSLPAILTVDELATFLRVNRKSVYDAVAKGEVPGARRIGRAIRISRDAMLEWLIQGRVPRSSRS